MNDPDGVRIIDHGTPPARFARGWHCLGLAARFRDGGPHDTASFASLAGTSLASGGVSSPPGHRNGPGGPYAAFGPAAAAWRNARQAERVSCLARPEQVGEPVADER